MKATILAALEKKNYAQAESLLETWFEEQKKLIITASDLAAPDVFLNDLLKILYQLLADHYLENNHLEQAEAFYKTWAKRIFEWNVSVSLAASYEDISHNQCLLVNIQTQLRDILENFHNLCVIRSRDLILRQLIIQQAYRIALAVFTKMNKNNDELLRIVNQGIYLRVFQQSLFDSLSWTEQAEEYAKIGKLYFDHYFYEEALAYYTQAYTAIENTQEEDTNAKARFVLAITLPLNKIEFYEHSLAKARVLLPAGNLKDFFSLAEQLLPLGQAHLDKFYEAIRSSLQQCLLDYCDHCQEAVRNNPSELKVIWDEILSYTQQLKHHQQPAIKADFLKKLLELIRDYRKLLPDYFDLGVLLHEQIHTEKDVQEDYHDSAAFEKIGYESLWLKYRALLTSFRQAFESTSKKDIWRAQGDYSLQIQTLLKTVSTDIVHYLGKTPQDFSFTLLGRGSISRGDMSLDSDIDAALLISTDQYREHPYLKQFIHLLDFHLKALGDPWKFDESTGQKQYQGLHLDGLSELINTPERMIKKMTSEFQQMEQLLDSDKSHETKLLNIAFSLYRMMPIFSYSADNTLYREYQQKLINLFELNKEDSKEVERIANRDYRSHLEDLEIRKTLKHFDLKKSYLSPVLNWCLDAALFKKVIDQTSADENNRVKLVLGIEENLERLSLRESFKSIIKAVLNHLYFLRFVEKQATNLAKQGQKLEDVLNTVEGLINLLYVRYLPDTKDRSLNSQLIEDPIAYAIQHLSEKKPKENEIILKSIAQTLMFFVTESIHLAYYQQIPQSCRKDYIRFLSEITAHPENLVPKAYHYPNRDGWRPIIEIKKREWYQALKSLFRQNVTPKQIDEARKAGQPIIRTYDLDHPDSTECQEYLLTEDAYNALFQNGEFRSKPKEQDGRHVVLPVIVKQQTFWFKLAPEQPAAETLTEELSWLLLGDGTPCTLVAKISRGSRTDVVLITEHVEHVQTLSAKDIKAYPERLNRITKKSFTRNFIRVQITNPEDDKGDDYLLVAMERENSEYELKRIDRERVFFQPDESQKSYFGMKEKKVLLVKSIINCLNQIYDEEALDEEELLQFAECLESEAVLNRWLQFGKKEESLYRQLFTQEEVRQHFNRQDLDFTLAGVFLPQGVVSEIWNRMEAMQVYIKFVKEIKTKDNKTEPLKIKPIRLIEKIQPIIANYYKPAFAKFSVQADQPEYAELRFHDLTKELFVLSAEGKRKSNLPGIIALTKNSNKIRLKEENHFSESNAVAIYFSKQESASQAVEELEAIIKEDTKEIAEEILSNKKEKKVWKTFALLSATRQMAIINSVLEKLGVTQKTEAMKENVNKFVTAGLRSVLQAMAKMHFMRLDLGPFCEVLTNDLLEPILISSGNYLITLNLDGCILLTSDVFEVLSKHCSNLESLSLKALNIEVLSLSPKNLKRIDLTDCIKLRSLQLSIPLLESCNLSNCIELSDEVLQRGLGECKLLDELVLPQGAKIVDKFWHPAEKLYAENKIIDENFMQAVMKSSYFKRIKKIHFRVCEITNKAIELLGKELSEDSCNQIQDLQFHDCHIETAGFIDLAHFLEKNTLIKTLILTGVKFSDIQAAIQIVKMLKVNRTLKEIRLPENMQISDEDAKKLAKELVQALKVNQTLVGLNLHGIYFGDKNIKSIVETLKENKTLKFFSISCTNIGSQTAVYLKESLFCNDKLVSLHLSGNNLGDNGCLEVIKLIEKNKSLLYLGLHHNDISAKGGQKILSYLKKQQSNLSFIALSSGDKFEEMSENKVNATMGMGRHIAKVAVETIKRADMQRVGEYARIALRLYNNVSESVKKELEKQFIKNFLNYLNTQPSNFLRNVFSKPDAYDELKSFAQKIDTSGTGNIVLKYKKEILVFLCCKFWEEIKETVTKLYPLTSSSFERILTDMGSVNQNELTMPGSRFSANTKISNLKQNDELTKLVEDFSSTDTEEETKPEETVDYPTMFGHK